MIKKAAIKGVAPNGGITFFESEINDKSTLAVKQYSATPTTLFPLTSITVTKTDGTTVVITSVSAATDEASLSSILKAEVKKIGYNFTEEFNLYKNLPSVKVSGQTLTVIGELTFTSMVAASGSPSFTAKVTQKGSTDYTKTAGTLASPVIKINGTNRAVTAWTMGTTSAGTVKTNIETALATEISAGTVISVAVTSDGTLYTIVLTCLPGTTALLQGASFTESNTRPYFV